MPKPAMLRQLLQRLPATMGGIPDILRLCLRLQEQLMRNTVQYRVLRRLDGPDLPAVRDQFRMRRIVLRLPVYISKCATVHQLSARL